LAQRKKLEKYISG
jgi:hypothetical protein